MIPWPSWDQKKKKVLCPVELGWVGEIRWEREVADNLESVATVRVGPCLSGDMLNKNVWLSGKVESNFGGLLYLALSGLGLILISAETV